MDELPKVYAYFLKVKHVVFYLPSLEETTDKQTTSPLKTDDSGSNPVEDVQCPVDSFNHS